MEFCNEGKKLGSNTEYGQVEMYSFGAGGDQWMENY